MADWILIPSLSKLRDEFNALAPGRDKASDGSVGDAAHAANVSDHNPDESGAVPIHDADSVNEVHAIDVDKSGPWPDGLSMETLVQFLLNRCRLGLETRLRYIIYNRRIWEASNGWAQRTYTGANPHTEHAHFSGSYDTAREASRASWHLEDLMALTDAEIGKIATAVHEKLLTVAKQADSDDNTNPVGRAVLDFQEIPNAKRGGKTPLWQVAADTQADIVAIRDMVADSTEVIVSGVLASLTPEYMGAAVAAAGITPEALAAALPASFAEDLLDRLVARLQA